MSVKLDKELEAVGTKFKLFPQARYLPSFKEPEIVHVKPLAGTVGPGPADDRMFVVDPSGVKKPYGPENGGGEPQYDGPKNDPVKPDAAGHFDHIDVDSRAFSCTTMYATVRRTLDIWEDYFGRQIQWFFRTEFEKLELIPTIEWDNAQSGYGFLEFGYGRNPNGNIDHKTPYCQNFDVLAHELGHNILFAEVGVPDQGFDTDEYGGFQESGGDLVAIVASLHFDSVVTHALESSKGNLFTVNELDRLGELPDGREIRVAFNYERMSTVGSEPHDLSLPLTGAIFDVFVDKYQALLVDSGLITQALADRAANGKAADAELPAIQKEFETAYAKDKDGFKKALLEARDYLGSLLAHAWSHLSPNGLTYQRVGLALLRADHDKFGGKMAKSIRDCLRWREVTLPSAHALTRRLGGCGMLGDRHHHHRHGAVSESSYALPAPVRER